MSAFTTAYLSYQMGRSAGQHFANNIFGSVTGTINAYNTVSAIGNIRKQAYDLKSIIASSDVTASILSNIIGANPQNPPYEIFMCSSFAAVSYNFIDGRIVTDETFCVDYLSAAALMLIIQDMYPDVYEINKVSVDELTQRLNSGTWYATLSKKSKYNNRMINPAFSVYDLQQPDISKVPLTTKDPLQKNKGVFALIAFLCLALSVVFLILGYSDTVKFYLPLLSSIAGVVISILGMRKASKICIASMIFCTLAVSASLVLALIQFLHGSL